ncbi:hypothetical protein Zmor_004439 [Zophobas morio]|uniref:Uncharacterized protein n=1 Tax=Zophobas morio TaxID=2755281 RepID=A0AA38M143_9CUCU|nr:hypothetical protein Zmor_004439 [Zophobas morio]
MPRIKRIATSSTTGSDVAVDNLHSALQISRIMNYSNASGFARNYNVSWKNVPGSKTPKLNGTLGLLNYTKNTRRKPRDSRKFIMAREEMLQLLRTEIIVKNVVFGDALL